MDFISIEAIKYGKWIHERKFSILELLGNNFEENHGMILE